MLDRLQKSKLNISVTIVCRRAPMFPGPTKNLGGAIKYPAGKDNENVLEIVSCWFSRKNESKL